jgi:hypothetical protein
VDLVHFTRALRAMTAEDIRTVAADLAELSALPADEVAGTKAVLVIEQTLHRQQRQSQGELAAYAVAQAVLAAAERNDIALPDSDVTRVARSAAMLARGIVAGLAVEDAVRFLSTGWRHVIGARVPA